MSWILFLVYFFIFLLMIRKLKLTKYKVINHQILYIIFITKIFVGILLNIVYYINKIKILSKGIDNPDE